MTIEDLTVLAARMILRRNREGVAAVNAQIAELPKRELDRLWKLVKKVLKPEDIEWFHQTLQES